MESRYIQLPYRVVNNRVKEKTIHLNLSPNYKKHLLFDQLPYSSHLENSSVWDVVSNGTNNKETLQKYLLATGIFESSIQHSLDMIVGDDGKLSDVRVRRQLDLKTPSVMKKSNLVDYAFKDIGKFDTQNPIVGEILKQTQKIDLDNLSSIKYIKIMERLDKLWNDRYHKNDNRPPPPGISRPTPQPKPPRPPRSSNDDDYFNLSSPPPRSYHFDSPYIPPAPDPPPLPYYRNSNIKVEDYDDDYDFDINFPEKNLTPTKNFLWRSRNTKKDVTNPLNNLKGEELEMVREEKEKVKKRLNLQIM